MKQLNVSKKVTAPLMVWVSIVLIVATLLFSFMPIMCLDTSINGDGISEMLGDIGGEMDIEIPEKVEITVGKLINSAKVIGKIINVAKEAANEASGNTTKKDGPSAAEELQAYMETPQGQETLLVAAAVGTTLANAFDFGENAHILSIVINILIVFVSLMSVLAFVFIIPIKVIIMLIKALIPALSNVKTPELAASKVSTKLPEMLGIPFTIMVFQTFIPGMTYGWGLIAMTVTVAVSVLFCTVITRLRTYEPKKFMYLNVVQGVSIVSIVGFFVFFFNILKTNVITRFLKGNFAKQLINLAAGKTAADLAKEPFEPNNAYITDFVLIFAFIIAFLSSVAYISFAANRLSCTVDPKNRDRKMADSKIVFAILMLVTYIAPTLVAGKTNFFYNVASKEAVGNESFLVLEAAETSALSAALVGIIIMIVAEVALIVLKKVLCKDLTALEASAIVCGRDEDTTVAAPAAEEAAVEAPAAEEAPAEEAPVAEEVSAE